MNNLSIPDNKSLVFKDVDLPDDFSLRFEVKHGYHGILGNSPITFSVVTLLTERLIYGTTVKGLKRPRTHMLLPRPDLQSEVFTRHLELAKTLILALTKTCDTEYFEQIKDIDFDPYLAQYPTPTFFIDKDGFVRQPPKDLRSQVSLTLVGKRYPLPKPVTEIMHPLYFQ